ncbi:predicted protein [Histoplasma capsulatum G186AR]|uniref:Uncharacterized protein n=1 Tax=Ajellomyces capsulatus (strain G186AR / H82 / ATCC MYA-2454 / RMSCC 2432) TaxID=447093 RepID=C0NLJ0_AJECG|nr:uncharacterized protein HCBG_04370 [Histoplasma capsulatum G186AR]EEH07491.1 predicted protein [Histoplasma capsulatum G186AR]
MRANHHVIQGRAKKPSWTFVDLEKGEEKLTDEKEKSKERRRSSEREVEKKKKKEKRRRRRRRRESNAAGFRGDCGGRQWHYIMDGFGGGCSTAEALAQLGHQPGATPTPVRASQGRAGASRPDPVIQPQSRAGTET